MSAPTPLPHVPAPHGHAPSAAFEFWRRVGPVLVVAVRCFGWGMLAVLAGFLINAYLIFWQGLPGISPLWQTSGSAVPWQSGLQGAIYLALFIVAMVTVAWRLPKSLREDARLISRGNAYLVRAMFWAVVLVGISDAAISLLRVEGGLDALVGSGLAGELGRSSFRGATVHMPLIALSFVLAAVTRTPGFPWLGLLVVVVELLIVIGRFVFSYEQAFMSDLVRFWYAALFLFASANTLLEEGHVRVDVFYAGFTGHVQGWVNAVGSVVMGLPLCWVILVVGLGSRQSIIASPLLTYETTQAGFGLYVKYLMAGFLGVFAVTMLIQFVSYLFDAVADIRGETDTRHRHNGTAQ